jgi:O-6-methylguanine DNA methyltransferase
VQPLRTRRVIVVADMQANEVTIARVPTPMGIFSAVFTPHGLSLLLFPSQPFRVCEDWARRWTPEAYSVESDPAVRQLEEQLASYFDGHLRQFTVPLDLRGTPFQKRVWSEVETVGYGEVRSYAQVAGAIGTPKAVRAVGAANGANPVPIIVPCHRIIGSNGHLVGYGGGLDMKRQLLELEGVLFGFN